MHYGVDVGRMLLLQLHPEIEGYAEHEVPDLREQVGAALETRRMEVLSAS